MFSSIRGELTYSFMIGRPVEHRRGLMNLEVGPRLCLIPDNSSAKHMNFLSS